MNKILFLTAFLPHSAAAAEKNTMIMLKELSKDFVVDLVYFKYSNQIEYNPNNANIRILKCYKNSWVKKIFNVLSYPILYPLFTVRYNFFIMRYINRISNVGNYKAVVFDHSQMFLYAKHMKDKRIPKLLLSHDIIAQRVGRTKGRFLTVCAKFSENYCLSVENAHLFALCHKDIDIVKELYGKDVNLCQLYIDRLLIQTIPQNQTNKFVFMGKWSRADNLEGVLWFLRKVQPLLKKKINIAIIGKDFPKEKLLDIDLHNVNLEILGFVDNPYPLIANSKALLAPLFTGAGIKVKVLDALACGSPVIGTEIAFEGIDDTFDKLMIRAQTAEEFANRIETINVDIETRVSTKRLFIDSFKDETIPTYLKNQLLL